ncbi:hypothetical protein TNCV_4429371 [Trichonephila clavipes]|nr:hypothetical protein TNCV_4429371 [Trichonephila clavipes]
MTFLSITLIGLGGGSLTNKICLILFLELVGSGGLEVAGPLRKCMVMGSTLAGVERFPGCENHRHAYHMIMWHVKDPLNINWALVFSAKLNHGSIQHPTRAGIKLIQAFKFSSEIRR